MTTMAEIARIVLLALEGVSMVATGSSKVIIAPYNSVGSHSDHSLVGEFVFVAVEGLN
jgi:hypothetical protein